MESSWKFKVFCLNKTLAKQNKPLPGEIQACEVNIMYVYKLEMVIDGFFLNVLRCNKYLESQFISLKTPHIT